MQIKRVHSDIIVSGVNFPGIAFKGTMYPIEKPFMGSDILSLNVLNEFFEKLEAKNNSRLLQMYSVAHSMIDQITVENRTEIEDHIHEIISITFARIDLAMELIDFCERHDKILDSFPDLSEAGSLPHHNPDRTFYRYDYIRLTSLSLLCKMVAPIWGALDASYKKIEINKFAAQIAMVELIIDIIRNSALGQTYLKMTDMVNDLCESRTRFFEIRNRTPIKDILSHNNLSAETYPFITLYTVFCKRLVKFDPVVVNPDIDESNIAVFIDQGVKTSVDTNLKSMLTKMKDR